MTTITTLVVPGLHSSGPAHWQTWFETRIPDAVRVIQRDWKRADLPEWASRVRREIFRRPGRILIAAHSFGALAAAQAADDHSERIAGALLVAPAAPEKFAVEDLIPQHPLRFPATVVASTNDPWMSLEGAARLAKVWGAQFVSLGAAGHINAEAGYGPWPEGLRLLGDLARKRVSTDAPRTSGEQMIRARAESGHAERRQFAGMARTPGFGAETPAIAGLHLSKVLISQESEARQQHGSSIPSTSSETHLLLGEETRK
jgi:predicted alpha/beta hydrolase family esterase